MGSRGGDSHSNLLPLYNSKGLFYSPLISGPYRLLFLGIRIYIIDTDSDCLGFTRGDRKSFA